MGKPLRYYQRRGVDAVFNYWGEESGHPLVDMATGAGKSLSMATLILELVAGWPDMRVVNCTHVIELVEGNFQELIGLSPFAPAGIYAASIGMRQRSAQILFAQLQTVWDKPAEIGHVDVLVIDEVQLVPADGNTMYRKFIDALLAINPDMKLVGFTATPYRLDSGRLDEGDDKLFDKVVYTYGIRQGIDDGYLTPISSKPTSTRLDITGVGRSMGDYQKGALQAAVDIDSINRSVVEEMMDVEGHRRKAILFCAGIQHAEHMRDLIQAAGRSCEVISGKTPKAQRRAMIEAYKAGEIWGMCNDNVLSTGTNVPGIDLMLDLAPTASAGRYAQRVGRMTRVIYPPGFDPEAVDADARRAAIASWIKPNGRYMNFAGNIERHGPVDQIEPKKPGKGEGEAPVKLCPNCQEICHASARRCTCCDHEFEFDETPKIFAKASIVPILSTDAPEWIDVTGQHYKYHDKMGGTPSVRVEYVVNGRTEKRWLCPQHVTYAKTASDRYWSDHGGKLPFPSSVDEFLERVSAGELRPTAQVKLKFGKPYNEVIETRAGDRPLADNDNTADVRMPKATVLGNLAALRSDRIRPAFDVDMDDSIPF